MGLGGQSGTCSLQHLIGGRGGDVAFSQMTAARNVVRGGWKQDVTWGLAPRKQCCTGGKLINYLFHQSVLVVLCIWRPLMPHGDLWVGKVAMMDSIGLEVKLDL